MNSGYVWVEKYRPNQIEDIVLDPINKQILENIVETGYFPNLFFYGPPGTGKTTTIINLINTYQNKYFTKNKELVIHLNASDERGIDIIRNQIHSFVNSKPLFKDEMKFVILDEVDYMTKTAQQALKYLLQNYNNNVRFCLICNYISKIDEGLQNEFIRLRFNQLPREKILFFLNSISINEKLNLSNEQLSSIQSLFKSDIRSMINFIQTNQNIENRSLVIINDTIWKQLLERIQQNYSFNEIKQHIYSISLEYNMEKNHIVNKFLNYIICNFPNYVTNEFLNFVENWTHSQNENIDLSIHYFITKMAKLLTL
jgi:replication factor C subunit 3/5